jgi:hypothetical protein
MALQSSGNAISFSDIQTEFGGENPISMSEYYQDAVPALVTANNANVGDVGEALAMSDFYDGILATLFTVEFIGGGGGGTGHSLSGGNPSGSTGGSTGLTAASGDMFGTNGVELTGISTGGGAGGSGDNGTLASEAGEASYYGAGGAGGINSVNYGSQGDGQSPAATSYGAGGGSGGTSFQWDGGNGGRDATRREFQFYGVPSASITVTIGAGGAGGNGTHSNGGAGAAGYAKFTVGNDVQEFTSSGTYTVPS